MAKQYSKGDRIPVRTQQLYFILTAQAVLKPDGGYEAGRGWCGWGPGIVSYSSCAVLMGMSPMAGRTLSRHLGTLGYWCLENDLPPLKVIAVNSISGEPGEGVVYSSQWKRDQKRVLEHDCSRSARRPRARCAMSTTSTSRQVARSPDPGPSPVSGFTPEPTTSCHWTPASGYRQAPASRERNSPMIAAVPLAVAMTHIKVSIRKAGDTPFWISPA